MFERRSIFIKGEGFGPEMRVINHSVDKNDDDDNDDDDQNNEKLIIFIAASVKQSLHGWKLKRKINRSLHQKSWFWAIRSADRARIIFQYVSTPQKPMRTYSFVLGALCGTLPFYCYYCCWLVSLSPPPLPPTIPKVELLRELEFDFHVNRCWKISLHVRWPEKC